MNSIPTNVELESMGASFARGFIQEGVNQAGPLLGSMGKGAGDGVSTVISDVIKGIKFDRVLRDLANEFNKGSDSFTSTLEFEDSAGNIGEGFGEGIRAFFENIKMDEIGKGIGDEFGAAIGNFQWKVLQNTALPIAAGMTLAIGGPLSIYYLFKKAVHNIGKPQLAQRVQRTTIFTPVSSRIQAAASRAARFILRRPASPKSDPIFNDNISRQIKNISLALTNTYKNGGYFQNILFYGPGGTGKTMIAEKLAKDSNFDFVMMSGGDLAQYIKRGEHVTELNKLMNSVKNGSKPTILFIDEIESLGRDRGKLDRSELLELQNAFLSHTGTASKKLILMGATNRKDDLDEAVLTRFDRKLLVGPPEFKERAKIIEQYAGHFFTQKQRKEFFREKQINAIAEKTEGFTGRMLFKMLNAAYNMQAASSTNKLTQDILDETINDFVEQERQLHSKEEPEQAPPSRFPWNWLGY